jgi:hypothetical protein
VLGDLAPDPAAGDGPPAWTGDPYMGLEFFDTRHAAIFRGRDAAIAGVVNHFGEQAAKGNPFVLVPGMSGSGKSSLVRAGVAPRFGKPGFIEGFGSWRQAIWKPSDEGGRLWKGLGRALMVPAALPELERLAGGEAVLAGKLETNVAGAVAQIEAALNMAAAGSPRSLASRVGLLLIADQLEEVFSGGAFVFRRREARLMSAAIAFAEVRNAFLVPSLLAELARPHNPDVHLWWESGSAR